MDGERSASANLAKLKKKMIRQNPASPKPRLREYLLLCFNLLVVEYGRCSHYTTPVSRVGCTLQVE